MWIGYLVIMKVPRIMFANLRTIWLMWPRLWSITILSTSWVTLKHPILWRQHNLLQFWRTVQDTTYYQAVRGNYSLNPIIGISWRDHSHSLRIYCSLPYLYLVIIWSFFNAYEVPQMYLLSLSDNKQMVTLVSYFKSLTLIMWLLHLRWVQIHGISCRFPLPSVEQF